MTVNGRILLGLGIAAAVSAAGADDLASRALRERQQQSDAFSLQLQQSIQSFRAGNLPPQQRLELDALQRDQRLRQDELFYRQQVETNSPDPGALRRADAMRAEQERQQQLSRFRSDAAPAAEREPAAQQPARLVDPTIVTAPVPRGRRRTPEPDPTAVGP
ncbi:MAG TPA: hypothetical protein VJM14_04720 [Burkholderiales bacterium]|nr:hypothetical protein [Burkholderiales bacterium]